MKRTEREAIADKLLCAAKHWQNGRGCVDCECRLTVLYGDHDVFGAVCGNGLGMDGWASAALSEVAALGFDIEEAQP